MKEKRIFIGSFVQTDSLKTLFDELKHKMDKKARVKWTRTPENFHITYKFLGDTPLDVIKEINLFLKENFNQTIHVDIPIKGIKYFKRKNKPAILYAGIDDLNFKLGEVQKKIDNFLIKNNYSEHKEKHFNPHITLGRIKSVTPEFYKILEDYNNQELGKIKEIKIEIIESKLSPQGSLYKPLKL
jgi:2'-5' RNA ligase